jgi:hypothetical protein
MTRAINLDEALDPTHAAVLAMLPADLMDLSDITAGRARLDGLLKAMPRPPMPADVTVTEVHAVSTE